MNKRFLSVLLFTSVIFVASSPTGNFIPNKKSVSRKLSIAESQTSDDAVIRKALHSPDFEKEYYCYEYSPTGYCIVDATTQQKIEFSLNSVSPYKHLAGDYLIYDGPMNYYTYTTNKQITPLLAKGARIKSEIISLNKNEAPKLQVSATQETLIQNSYYISSLTNFKRSNGEPYNNNNTCGYLALAMVLYYSKYQYNYNFIDDKYIETEGETRRFTSDFHDYLVSIGKDLGIGHETTALSIKKVAVEYCNRINIKTNHFAMLLSTPANISLAIANNNPIALFGNFKNQYSGERVNHAVTCYGYYDEVASYNATMRYLIVNFGYSSDQEKSYNRVYLYDSLFTNPIGSMYNINYGD